MTLATVLKNAFPGHAAKAGRRAGRGPVFGWLLSYRREYLVGDLMAGLIVAIMLVPQSMAYALLAGLPPEVGLYASILPLILYGLLGSSHALSVGPVAIVSLLVATAIGPLAESGTEAYLQLALTLALLVGVVQLVMGVMRLGFLVNFLSHPLLAGFTSAAAIIIGFSQLKNLLGLSMPRTPFFHESVMYLFRDIDQTHLMTLSIGLGSVGLLLYFRHRVGDQLRRWGVPEGAIMPLTKAGPLAVVFLGTLLVGVLNLNEAHSVSIVGNVPSGLPPVSMPSLDLNVWQALSPTALTIGIVGYMQSIAVAKALASKRRKKIGVNKELVALGAANLGAAFTAGFPVTGGFSRSAVNDSAGANTPLASMITAGLMGLVVILMTPVFFYLPTAVLAAIILVAVGGLIDFSTFRRLWRYSKDDAASMAITFLAVLVVGVEKGILAGVIVTIALRLWRTSRPHIAVVGRWSERGTFHDVQRHSVETCVHVVAVRVDESLYFANINYLEEKLLDIVAEQSEVEHIVLDGTSINSVDASALNTLEGLIRRLGDAGVTLHLSGVKGPVMDTMQDAGFVQKIGLERIHAETQDAFETLGCA
jgi:SulP family sulfate permease